MRAKDKRLRRKRRLERKAIRGENAQERHEQRQRCNAEWSVIIADLQRCLDPHEDGP